MKSIIVLGMHRSGTSAITGAIGQLGAAMGPKSRMRKHWENIPLRKFNDRLLTLGNGSWDAPPPVGWLAQPAVRALVPEARALVAEQFGSASVAVWKDPRTCVTMPFWNEVLDEPPVFLVIYRHPAEVAASLADRNSFRPAHSYAIWERYNADALQIASGRPTVVLEYGKVVAEPVEALEIIVTAFSEAGVPLPHDPATTDHGLVAQARHHTSETPDTLSEVATAAQRDLFELLRRLEGAHQSLDLPAPIPAQHASSLELLTLAAGERLAKRARKGAKKAAKQAAAEAASMDGAAAGAESKAAARAERRKARRESADGDPTTAETGPATAATARAKRRSARRQAAAVVDPDASETAKRVARRRNRRSGEPVESADPQPGPKRNGDDAKARRTKAPVSAGPSRYGPRVLSPEDATATGSDRSSA